MLLDKYDILNKMSDYINKRVDLSTYLYANAQRSVVSLLKHIMIHRNRKLNKLLFYVRSNHN